MKSTGVIGKIAGGFADSARTVHEINRENMAAVKADSRANFEAATTPDPGFVKFRQAKGIGNKAKVVLENIKESAKENSAREKERSAEIQSHESYRALLEETRAGRLTAVRS
jgi:hypothetical protein